VDVMDWACRRREMNNIIAQNLNDRNRLRQVVIDGIIKMNHKEMSSDNVDLIHLVQEGN
jgi:aspartyl-tRNA synthetase